MSNDTKGGPVTLYLDGKSTTVHPIDADGWRANGWGDDPETVTPAVEDIVERAEEDDSVDPSADVQVPAVETVTSSSKKKDKA